MSTNDRPSQLTPMLRQYVEIKKQYPGTMLFFRLGDFYELFFDDALLGARELEITLTARHKERGEPVPMCGVPYHAATGYIAKLVKKGYRVAICEQTEDPKSSTKLVRREVVRVITPGTALESQLLESKQNSYLASICGSGEGMGIAFLDLSTGEFLTTQFSGEEAWQRLQEQLEIFAPKEIVFPHSLTPLVESGVRSPESGVAEQKSALNSDSGLSTPDSGLRTPDSFALSDSGLPMTPLDDWLFGYEHAEPLLRAQLGVASLDGFGLADKAFAVCAAGAIVHYVMETQKSQALHISEISYFEPSEYLVLDATTVNNLELISSNDGVAAHSLIGILDETMTGMGARLLRQWLLRPSVRPGEISTRLDAVEELKSSTIKRDQLRKTLDPMADLERLAGKVTLGRANARDLLALKQSIEVIPSLKRILADSRASLLQVITENLDELEDLRSLVAEAIADEPPASTSEPGMMRDGFNPELDELRNLARSGKSYIAAIEARERGRTRIASLKVKFNNVFG
ncbi:MAG: DNA mismatch repair protein MutS, partial [Blastocatellia bacterium]|nr:DNA mismatch repair protein MutS [Blastocatellia bacterium]